MKKKILIIEDRFLSGSEYLAGTFRLDLLFPDIYYNSTTGEKTREKKWEMMGDKIPTSIVPYYEEYVQVYFSKSECEAQLKINRLKEESHTEPHIHYPDMPLEQYKKLRHLSDLAFSLENMSEELSLADEELPQRLKLFNYFAQQMYGVEFPEVDIVTTYDDFLTKFEGGTNPTQYNHFVVDIGLIGTATLTSEAVDANQIRAIKELVRKTKGCPEYKNELTWNQLTKNLEKGTELNLDGQKGVDIVRMLKSQNLPYTVFTGVDLHHSSEGLAALLLEDLLSVDEVVQTITKMPLNENGEIEYLPKDAEPSWSQMRTSSYPLTTYKSGHFAIGSKGSLRAWGDLVNSFQ